MTREQIDSVLERVRSWPQEDQEELADLVREIEARRTGIYILNDEEREAIAKAPAIASVALRFLPDAGHADVSCKLSNPACPQSALQASFQRISDFPRRQIQLRLVRVHRA